MTKVYKIWGGYLLGLVARLARGSAAAIVIALVWIASSSHSIAQTASPPPQQKPAAMDTAPANPDKPLYSPFTARYLLDEIKLLRIEFEKSRAELLVNQVQREYRIAKDAAGYAQNAVELFFYIIVAVTTLLVFVGWNSLRDIHARVREIAEARVDNLVAGYSKRLDGLESELEQKTKRLQKAQREIWLTNEIHSLWLRASQEVAPAAKIAIYDEILKLRSEDIEAMTYKADAALQLEQPQWALSLTNRALEIEPENGQALYQRACANASLGSFDEAVVDLGAAIAITDSFKDQARVDPAFASMKDVAEFQNLTHVEEIIE